MRSSVSRSLIYANISITGSTELRTFSTQPAVPKCGFSEDFPAITKTMSTYNKALYNHLRKVFVVDQALQVTFMELTDKVDEKSQSEMARLRKEMANN